MIELIFLFLALPTLAVTFAVLTNLYRDHRRYHIELKPNCLLTRHPVVFVTGPRSVFYFRKYWNAYPEILAEHGYEVFTLHLPWQGPQRKNKLQDFLHQQDGAKRFHFICDPLTLREMRTIFETSAAVASLTEFKNEITDAAKVAESFTLNLAYKFHALRHSSTELPCARDLGMDFPADASRLLKKMQSLGEQDYLA
jgi:hypothetical protein